MIERPGWEDYPLLCFLCTTTPLPLTQTSLWKNYLVLNCVCLSLLYGADDVACAGESYFLNNTFSVYVVVTMIYSCYKLLINTYKIMTFSIWWSESPHPPPPKWHQFTFPNSSQFMGSLLLLRQTVSFFYPWGDLWVRVTKGWFWCFKLWSYFKSLIKVPP